MDVDAVIDQAVTDAQILWGERVSLRPGARGLTTERDRSIYHNRWTREEDEFYLANAGSMSLEEIGARLGRSPEAIKSHFTHKGFPAPSKQPGFLTGQSAANLLGLDNHKVTAWMDAGIMPGEHIPTGCAWRVYHRVSITLFKMWLIRPASWIYFDARKIKNESLRRLALRAQQRWGDEWWTCRQAGDYLGVDPKSIEHQIRHHHIYGIQAVNKGGRHHDGRWSFWYVRKSEAVQLRIGKGKGRNKKLYTWPAGADAFLLRSREQGLTWEVIGRMMKWRPNRCAYRYSQLIKAEAGQAVRSSVAPKRQPAARKAAEFIRAGANLCDLPPGIRRSYKIARPA